MMSRQELDVLIKDLRSWRVSPKSLGIMQFCKQAEISWSTLSLLRKEFPRFNKEFEVTVAHLWDRWFEYFFAEKIPPHRQRLIEKYISKYDLHIVEMELEAKKSLVHEEAKASIQVLSDNFANEPLEQPYKQMYERNEAKKDK